MLLPVKISQMDSGRACSQNPEKVTHIKGRLLDQTVILFNCVLFHNEHFSEKKEFAPSLNFNNNKMKSSKMSTSCLNFCIIIMHKHTQTVKCMPSALKPDIFLTTSLTCTLTNDNLMKRGDKSYYHI